tara:strand:- start:79 stop:297 length:219 start_codon:yes stop_codon:yes gene_type:complete
MNDMDRVKKRRESYAEKNKLSPCIGVCSINPEDNYCYGCKRTQKEINNWIYYTLDEIKQLLPEIEARQDVDD